MAKDRRCGLGEARSQPIETAAGRARVVQDRDRGVLHIDGFLGRQEPAQLRRVHVATHRRHRRTERLDLREHLAAHDVPGMQDQVGAAHHLDAARRDHAAAAWKVCVGDDRDQHGACFNMHAWTIR